MANWIAENNLRQMLPGFSMLSTSLGIRELHGDGDHGNPAVTTVTPR